MKMWPTAKMREEIQNKQKKAVASGTGSGQGTLFDTFLGSSKSATTSLANSQAQITNTVLSSYQYNKDDIQFRCMPHFIIAGAQKSGTTALSGRQASCLFVYHCYCAVVELMCNLNAALLASLRFVSFHPKKEAHFFDKTEFYNKGFFSYLETYK
jgi:hypothetical protein